VVLTLDHGCGAAEHAPGQLSTSHGIHPPQKKKKVALGKQVESSSIIRNTCATTQQMMG